MRNNKHGAVIKIGDSLAFIDGIPDKCQHDDVGSTIHVTASGKTITWKTFKKWASYTSQLRDPLIIAHQETINDPVVSASVSCSKCGRPWEIDIHSMP